MFYTAVTGMLIISYLPTLSAQDTAALHAKAPDTVVLGPSQVKQVSISCPVISGYGSGDMELIAINSESDATSAFGYNCSVPDSDYTNYSLLCCTILSAGSIKWKVETAGDNYILSVSGVQGAHRTYLYLLTPHMPPNGNVHLDLDNLRQATGR